MTANNELRRRAEEIVRKMAGPLAEHPEALSLEESRQTLHELLVHQIELEMQNEELRRIQLELEASRARYFDLYDLAPVGYFTVNEKGLILEANLATGALLGVTRGELIKRPLSNFILTEDQDIYYRHRKTILEMGEPHVCELRMRRANVDPFWAQMEATATRDVDGAPVSRVVLIDITQRKQAQAVLEQAHDTLERQVKERTAELTAANKQLQSEIDERKQVEEALRASEEQFRVAFEEAGAAMVITVGDGSIARVNAAFAHLTGYSREDMVGMPFLDVISTEDRGRIQRMHASIMAEQMSHFTLEHRYQGKGDSAFWGQTTTAAVHGPNGEVRFALSIIEDITARKQAEEALRMEQRTLSHMLEASDHERQMIAYEIHDELAQQLTGAIMQFQTYQALKDAKPRLAMKAYQEGMALLHRGHNETRRLIAGVRPPVLDELGIVAAIAHFVNEQNSVGNAAVEYHSQVHFDRLAPLLENAIYRIVQEGVANACHHSHSERVLVSLEQEQDHLCIEIRDWGVGFDANATPEDRFGLEGIRQRVRLLDGNCSIRSEPGKGTTITAELPLSESDLVPCLVAAGSEA